VKASLKINEAACCAPAGELVDAKASPGFSQLLRALGDETRFQIIALLASASDALCVCEIEARFDLSQATISHHLRVLRDAGVVSASKRGTWVYYAVDVDRVDDLLRIHKVLRR